MAANAKYSRPFQIQDPANAVICSIHNFQELLKLHFSVLVAFQKLQVL